MAGSQCRAQEIETRFNDSTINLPEDASPTPRFIMLHTLAHILIREFETSAGYPASSLQERLAIYFLITSINAGIPSSKFPLMKTLSKNTLL
jgi:hypothetical protein